MTFETKCFSKYLPKIIWIYLLSQILIIFMYKNLFVDLQNFHYFYFYFVENKCTVFFFQEPKNTCTYVILVQMHGFN